MDTTQAELRAFFEWCEESLLWFHVEPCGSYEDYYIGKGGVHIGDKDIETEFFRVNDSGESAEALRMFAISSQMLKPKADLLSKTQAELKELFEWCAANLLLFCVEQFGDSEHYNIHDVYIGGWDSDERKYYLIDSKDCAAALRMFK